MTANEQSIYNLYLSVTRSAENKPFKLRKDFSDFEQTEYYIFIKKLTLFFAKFPQIKPKFFFEAPYKIYSSGHFDLKYYVTQKAIKSYSLYMKQKREELPDSLDHISFIKESLLYIAKYCFDHKLKLSEYSTYKTHLVYEWLKHVHEHNVSLYVMMGFDNIMDIINEIPIDEMDLFLSDAGNTIHTYKIRYNESKQAKQLIINGLTKINKLLTVENNKN
jgi:hypothetical protein